MSYRPGPEYPPDWLELSGRIKARDGGKCVECGNRDRLHVHHRTPILKGGTHDPSNLETLCWRCHAKKHPRLAQKMGVPVGGISLGTVATVVGIILFLWWWKSSEPGAPPSPTPTPRRATPIVQTFDWEGCMTIRGYIWQHPEKFGLGPAPDPEACDRLKRLQCSADDESCLSFQEDLRGECGYFEYFVDRVEYEAEKFCSEEFDIWDARQDWEGEKFEWDVLGE